MSAYHFNPHDCNWLPVNTFLFQIANFLLLCSYVVPDNLNGLFMLRFFLGTAGLFFALWAWWNICAPDTLAWNVFFMIGNYVHAVYMFIHIRRPRKFPEHCEMVYEKLFEPLGVKRFQFQILADNCSIAELNTGDLYAEKDAFADRISILLHGIVQVKSGNHILHAAKPFEFLDSPEWVSNEPNKLARYGISLVAKDDIKFLQWKSDVLRKLLMKDRFLKNVFDSLIGQDVTRKLLLLTKSIGDSQLDVAAYRVGSLLYLHQELMETNINHLDEGVSIKENHVFFNTVSRTENTDTLDRQGRGSSPLIHHPQQPFTTSNGITHRNEENIFHALTQEQTPLIGNHADEASFEISSLDDNECKETIL